MEKVISLVLPLSVHTDARTSTRPWIVSSLERVTEIESAESSARCRVWVKIVRGNSWKSCAGKFMEKLMQGKVGMATVSVKLENYVLFVVFVGKL